MIENDITTPPPRRENTPRAALVGDDGAVQLPAMRLPFSAYASAEARRLFVHSFEEGATPPGLDLLGLRAFYNRFNDRLLERTRARFNAEVTESTIAGVPVLRVRRAGSPPPRRRIINLHGGGFAWGAGSGALVEAIPVACLADAEVIAIQYSLAPEHLHPAAAIDVAAVYAELLKQHPAASIGIFGCSAGALLTAQVLALLDTQGIPQPGAIGLLSGAGNPMSGDSTVLALPACGEASPAAPLNLNVLPYFTGASADDPQVFPSHSPALLQRFPPTLLLCGSRDFWASAATHFHRQLLAAGVDARLVMFDGMAHAFHIYPELPESLEANTLLARFFDAQLLQA